VTNDEDGGGAVGQFDQLYNQFGNTFKEARWNHDKTFIYALMARDNEEVLIVQNVADPNSPPMPIAAGDRINFDVSPIDGSLVFAVRNFRFPLLELVPEQFIVNNRVVVPFRNALAMLNPEQSEPFKLVAASDTDEVAFASPAISPDGKSIVVVVGEAGDDFAFTPLTLVLLPAAELSAPQAQPLLEGSVYEPAWSPDGTRIVFALTEGTNRNIYTISSSGTNRRKVSPDGVFSHPSFSPQR
jgi:Tol biopolymer transport system component